jgi:hypothetical protein
MMRTAQNHQFGVRCCLLIVTCIAVGGAHGVGRASAIPLGLQWTGWNENSESAADMDVVQRSGATYYRQEINWGVVRRQTWKPYEEIFRLATERGLTILPYLYGNGQEPGSGKSEKALPAFGEWPAWEGFVKEAVAKFGYGGSFWAAFANPKPVSAWEVWNEPNLPENGPEGTHVDAAAYGEVLKRSFNMVHNTEKGGTSSVLVGGLFNTSNLESFLVNLNKSSSAYYNGVGVHPYWFKNAAGGDPQPADVPFVTAQVLGAIETVHRNVPAGRGVWVTELGWPIASTDPETHPAVSRAVQAELLTSAFGTIQAKAAALNIRAVFWNSCRSIANPTWAYNMGLRTFEGKFLESWGRFQQQAGVAAWPPAPRIVYQANTGDLWTFTPPNGLFKPGIESLAPNTSPSISGPSGSKTIAYQGKDNDLRVDSDSGGFTHLGLGMAAGTSPSVAELQGGYVVAYQANTGNLWLYSSPSTVLTNLGPIAANTDPSVTPLQNGEYAVAWQGSNHNLYTYLPKSGVREFGLGLSTNTSPSIAPSGSSGYVVAMRANTGSLWRYSSPLDQAVDLKTQVAINTSPSITSVDPQSTNYAIAWNSPSGNVSAYESSTGKVTAFELSASAEASPDISPVEGSGWRIVYRANTGILWTRTNTGATGNLNQPIPAGTDPVVATESQGNTEIAYASGSEALLSIYKGPANEVNSLSAARVSPTTSPAAARLSNGSYAIAYQGVEHDLWRYTPESGSRHDYLGMTANTSPAVTGLPNNSYQVAFQANTGNLVTVSPNGSQNLALGMAANTSPSIATLSNGSYVIAFQTNKGNLAVYRSNPGYVEEYGLGMAAGTSPAITAFASKFAVAFRANTGKLWTLIPNPAKPFGEADIHETPVSSEAGTNPSIAALGAALEIAYTAPGGSLYTDTYIVEPGGGDTVKFRNLGLFPGTSPSLSAQTGNVIALTANTGYLWFFEPDPDVGTQTGLGLTTTSSPAVAPG